MRPLVDLAIRLPPRGSGERLQALHRQLKAAIAEGRLQAGVRLPSTRALAAALQVSRNTAVAAYELLLAEGYLVARRGAGTRVAALAPRLPGDAPPAESPAGERRLAARWRHPPATPALQARVPCRFDFATGVPDTALLPLAVWHRLAGRCLRRFARGAGGYAEPQGQGGLREAIAQHVSFTRAVACRAEDIVVAAGAQQVFDLLARILVTPARTAVAVEDPGYPPLRAAFEAAGGVLVPVPVDEEGLVVERLPAHAKVICVTPSHQFPLGVALSARRRAALLAWAQGRGAVIVEDDYDGEFRFGGRPLDALQTMDRAGSVFYVGTFSKSLFPALRIGFVAAPAWARPALVAAKQAADWHVPALAQDTLADFIAEGHLARHVRRMRRVYAERREALLAALARHAGWLQPLPSEAGLHLAVRIAERRQADSVVAHAAAAGVGVESLGRYAVDARWQGLAFGYGTMPAQHIDEAIRRLSRAARA